MIIFHANHRDNGLLLWGERPANEGGGSPARRGRGRKPKIPRPVAYPFDAGLEGLASALEAAAVGWKADQTHSQTVTAWLPSHGGMPIPSSPLIAEPPETQPNAALAPWTVQALLLTPEEAVELLCACADRRTLAPGVVVGRDLAFWAQALRFAGALVARQQYLPGLEAKDGRYRARWDPAFAGADADHLAALARGMPPVARALSGPEATGAGAIAAIKQAPICAPPLTAS